MLWALQSDGVKSISAKCQRILAGILTYKNVNIVATLMQILSYWTTIVKSNKRCQSFDMYTVFQPSVSLSVQSRRSSRACVPGAVWSGETTPANGSRQWMASPCAVIATTTCATAALSHGPPRSSTLYRPWCCWPAGGLAGLARNACHAQF